MTNPRRSDSRGCKAVGLLGAVAALSSGCFGGSERGRVSDVVLIVVDTLRADAILDPEGRYETPNIDALARDGVLFEKAFSHAPMTLPAHASLFSSRIPSATGILNNSERVPAEVPLLAEWLAAHEYDTRGVISLGTLQNIGIQRGFGEYDQKIWYQAAADEIGEKTCASLAGRDPERPLFLFAHFSDPHSPYHDHRGDKTATVHLNGEAVGSQALSSLDVRSERVLLGPGTNVFEVTSERPFKARSFVVLENREKLELDWVEGEHNGVAKRFRIEVERPVDAPEAECSVRSWFSDSPRRFEISQRYAREVRYVDHYLGMFLDRLKDEGLYDDATIVFTSDHGEALGEHDYFGHVHFLTDEQIHVPLIVKLPKESSSVSGLAARRDSLVRHIDLVPTLLELAGLPPLPGQQGVDLLRAEPVTHLAQTHRPEARADKVALRDEHFKLIFDVEEARFRMYDLEADPEEERDVFELRGSERIEWQRDLRVLGEQAAARSSDELDDERREQMEALGYAQ